MLIDNFVDAYRCAAHSAGNGRQWFEVPSFLALTGAATATILGAGETVPVIAGAANQILPGGKAYYVPQQKAEIFDHALDAILCIKTEAVGVPAFSTDLEGRVLRDGGSVEVSFEEQYFHLVAAALLSVERAMAQRLSTVGKFDPAGVVAEIEKLKKEEDAAADAAGKSRIGAADFATLQLDVLQPRLQKCVVRAKM